MPVWMPSPVTDYVPWLTTPRLLMMVAILMGVVLAMRMLGGRARHPSRRAKGTVEWSSRRQLRREGAFNDHGMFLGRAYGHYLRAPFEQNVVVFGPPGEGKSVTNVLTTLTACDEASAMVIDFTGDIVQKTASHRRTLGPVHILDLNDPQSPDQCDVGDLIRWNTSREFQDCQRISSHIVRPRGMMTSSGAEHYERVAQGIIPLAALALRYRPRHHRGHYLGLCHDLLEYFSTPGATIPALIEEMGALPHPTLKRGAARLLKQTRSSLQDDWNAAAEWLTLWEDATLARNTSRTTIPWQQLQHGERPMTFYLRVSPDDAKGRLRPVIRLLLDQLLFLLTNRASTDHVRDLLIIIDDVAQLGHLPILEDIAADKRKYGIRLMVVFQSPSQLWHDSGRHYTGLLNACGCWVIYRQNEPDAAKYLAAKIGERPVMEPADRVSSRGFGYKRTYSWGEQLKQQPLLNYSEILSLHPDLMVVCIKGLKVLAKRINAYARSPFKVRLSAGKEGRY